MTRTTPTPLETIATAATQTESRREDGPSADEPALAGAGERPEVS
ncbi:hypothetical protein [Natronolimnohabitans innermongolicus]|nr:hypothetical protein [Natronolimnohabitans innermongolicus]